MTDIDIIMGYIKLHPEKIPTVAYTNQVYEFIQATADMMEINGEKYYKVSNQWQQIKLNQQY